MNILKENFYHDQKGNFTNIYENLGNCYSRNVFFILRHLLYKQDELNINELYKGYLEDLNFYLIKSNTDDILYIDTFEVGFWKKMVKEVNSIEFSGDGKNAMQKLESLVNSGEVVLIRSNGNKLKFRKSLTLDINESENISNINFLALSIKDELVYYLYSYSLCNKEYLKTCDENQSIGVAPKEDFFDAFNDYVELSTITADFSELNNINSNILVSISNSIENYFSSTDIQNSLVLSGRMALEFMLEKLKNEGILFDLSNKKCDKNELVLSFESLRHAIVLLIRRRKQYINMFEILKIQQDNIIKSLISKLENSVEQWEAFMNLIKYSFFKKECLVGYRGVKFIENILRSDDNLFTFMDKNKIYLYNTLCNN